MLRDRLAVPFEVKFAEDAETGTFTGYGAVFGNVDAYGDVIQKGAFRETLRDWKAKQRLPPMLLQHGMGAFFGGGADDLVPVGRWTEMAEDEHGLKVEGKLFALDTDRGRYLHAALKEGALDGMSIGYTAKEYSVGTKPDEPRRTIKKLHLWELSLVTFPANDKALIADVKSAAAATERDFERWLTRDAGFSRSDAVTIINRGFKAWKTMRDAGAGADDETKAALRGLIATLKP